MLKQKLSQIYDIAQDDANIRACVKEGKVEQKAFDLLRKNYPLRREWAAHGDHRHEFKLSTYLFN